MRVNVRLLHYNYYKLFSAMTTLSPSAKAGSDFYLMDVDFKGRFLSKAMVSDLYDSVLGSLGKFKRNKYFFRIVNCLFLGFCFTKIDVRLIVNAISFEIRHLRGKHRYFMNFIGALLRTLFTVFKPHHPVVGLRITFKGRLILYIRETRRKTSVLFKVGSVPITRFDREYASAYATVASRYGAISVRVLAVYALKRSTQGLLPIQKWGLTFSTLYKFKNF